MPHILAYDLVEAFPLPGCPLCRTLAADEERWIESFWREGRTGRNARLAFYDAGGFCRRHGWLLHRSVAAARAPAAVADVYGALADRDLERLGRIAEERRSRRRSRALLARAAVPRLHGSGRRGLPEGLVPRRAAPHRGGARDLPRVRRRLLPAPAPDARAGGGRCGRRDLLVPRRRLAFAARPHSGPACRAGPQARPPLRRRTQRGRAGVLDRRDPPVRRGADVAVIVVESPRPRPAEGRAAGARHERNARRVPLRHHRERAQRRGHPQGDRLGLAVLGPEGTSVDPPQAVDALDLLLDPRALAATLRR